jgi:DNA replicative helicase MCM subunit Mcm2 (Cdc46/Mcm family)
MRLSPTVELSDAEMALRVLDSSLVSVAYDKETGTFDIDKMCNKMSMSTRSGIELVKKVITDMRDQKGVRSVSFDEVCLALPSHDPKTVEKMLEDAYREGVIISPRLSRYSIP